jgi:probable phosphoglycerate mutase
MAQPDVPETLDFTPLWLIRHGQSEWNASGRWQGQADPPLSPAGEAQAEALAEQLAGELVAEGVALLESSDLRRAQATAEPLARRLGLPVCASPVYRELDAGEWSGLRREEIEARDPDLLARFDREASGARPPGGETREVIRERARAAIEALGAAHEGQRIVIVTHLGFIRALVPGASLRNTEVVRTSVRAVLALRPPAGVRRSVVDDAY